MILIKTLFLNLIPEEVTVVEPEALVGRLSEAEDERILQRDIQGQPGEVSGAS